MDMRFYQNLPKKLFKFSLSIVLFIYAQQAFAQPLDPALPGYEEVRPPSRPTLKIIAPENASTVLGPQLTVEYIVSGVSLVEQGKKETNIKGEGHLRLVFAREGYPLPTPIPFARKSPITFEALPEGNYRITMEVVKNNGASFRPPVQDTTKFQVVYPVTLAPTLTPIPTQTPVPLRQKIPFTRRELLIFLAVVFLVGPAVYLFFRWSGKSVNQ